MIKPVPTGFIADPMQLAGEKAYEVGRYSAPFQIVFEEGAIHSHMYVQLLISRRCLSQG